MSPEKTKKGEVVDLIINNKLANVWIDTFNVNGREDGIFLIRFFTNLPEGQFEQSRIMVNKKTLKGFIDSICSSINYYPEKKIPESKSGAEKMQ